MRKPRSILFWGTFLLCGLIATGVYGLWRLAGAPVPRIEPRPAAVSEALVEAETRLKTQGMARGLPVYIRIFKQESRLELWMKKNGRWALFNKFPICKWSGRLGPKLKEGDRQAPEGFYSVKRSNLHPHSSNYLAFNLGFPNAYDRAHRRTGSYLMVHGDCRSIGCYAMTDPAIAVIYRLVEAALKNGQESVPVHIYPFRMTAKNLSRRAKSKWHSFWRQLRPAWQSFEKTKQVPQIKVIGDRYTVSQPSA